MITLHKTETARQNKTLSIFFETPQNFTNHVFRGAHAILRGAELLAVRALLEFLWTLLLLPRSATGFMDIIYAETAYLTWSVYLLAVASPYLLCDSNNQQKIYSFLTQSRWTWMREQKLFQGFSVKLFIFLRKVLEKALL